ncbi:MAG: succinyl-diaminopimelate desuccinylase [Campylobacterales bacterium]
MNVIQILEKLISCKSITPLDDGSLKFVREYLQEFEVIDLSYRDVKNLFLYKKTHPNPHLCFAGHIDVVPPGDGWKTPPFEPTTKEGYIYGRGAQDMKSGVAAMLNPLKELSFEGTLSLLLTSDEEGDAEYGTKYALSQLKKIDLLPDFAIIGEPTSQTQALDAIKIGRRGSINGELEILGEQGHVAYYKEGANPTEIVAKKLDKIAGVKLDSGDENFEPSRIVISNINGGVGVTNVTPKSVKIVFNVRNSPNTTLSDVESYIKDVFEGYYFTLKIKQSSKPFITDRHSPFVKKCSDIIADSSGIETSLSTSGGTSDARFFAEYKIPTVEMGVVNDRIHATNERVGIDEVELLEKVFRSIIRSF